MNKYWDSVIDVLRMRRKPLAGGGGGGITGGGTATPVPNIVLSNGILSSMPLGFNSGLAQYYLGIAFQYVITCAKTYVPVWNATYQNYDPAFTHTYDVYLQDDLGNFNHIFQGANNAWIGTISPTPKTVNVKIPQAVGALSVNNPGKWTAGKTYAYKLQIAFKVMTPAPGYPTVEQSPVYTFTGNVLVPM